MNIGSRTFAEVKKMVEDFHGYAAPGVLIGGYMVAAAQKALPEDTLFEALVETPSCLPDAVQMLTPCTAGNKRLHILDHGKMALSLFDKYTGRGVRCFVAPSLLSPWPEIRSWIMREKSKNQQDSALLELEIEQAGDSILSSAEILVSAALLDRKSSGSLTLCPVCGESYPRGHGEICRTCRGNTPFSMLTGPGKNRRLCPTTRIRSAMTANQSDRRGSSSVSVKETWSP
jgi:formylmethanofuran dehydrogenase subunit E